VTIARRTSGARSVSSARKRLVVRAAQEARRDDGSDVATGPDALHRGVQEEPEAVRVAVEAPRPAVALLRGKGDPPERRVHHERPGRARLDIETIA
jgi:hypothetical protein